MPDAMDIRGIQAVERVFRNISKVMQARIANALNVGADEIVTEAKAIVEVYTAPHLRDSIRRSDLRVRADVRSVQVFVWAGDSNTMQPAYRNEFGRESGGTSPNERHPGITEQPFFFPAYFRRRNRIRSRIAREIKNAAREAIARYGYD